MDRTNAAGKASSVQFIHFPFTPEQVRKFRQPGIEVTLGISHPAYGHIAIVAGGDAGRPGAGFRLTGRVAAYSTASPG